MLRRGIIKTAFPVEEFSSLEPSLHLGGTSFSIVFCGSLLAFSEALPCSVFSVGTSEVSLGRIAFLEAVRFLQLAFCS